jgi:hypothetical protein
VTHTYEQISAWLDEYFEAVNANQGALELVAKSGRFFADDLEFHMYTSTDPGGMSLPWNRERLLMSFVHPGLHESITPNYYVIDTNAMKVVVQFELAFSDEESGTTWTPRQASAHYHLKPDAAGRLQISRIQYWTEVSNEDFAPVLERWEKGRTKALLEFGGNYFKQSR